MNSKHKSRERPISATLLKESHQSKNLWPLKRSSNENLLTRGQSSKRLGRPKQRRVPRLRNRRLHGKATDTRPKLPQYHRTFISQSDSCTAPARLRPRSPEEHPRLAGILQTLRQESEPQPDRVKEFLRRHFAEMTSKKKNDQELWEEKMLAASGRDFTLKSEFQRYIDDGLVDIGASTALEWWTNKAQRTRFPSLSRMAINIQSIPTISVEIKRLFSTAKNIIGDKRYNLRPSTIETLECLKS